MKNVSLLILVIFVFMAGQARSQQPGSSSQQQASENAPDVTYHLVTLLPQYRFVSTSGNPSRVGEYDSLQQSVGGDVSLNEIFFPQHLTLKYSASFISQDDYEMKARLNVAKWLDIGLDSRSFIRHVDDNSNFAASIISPDIRRTDTIPADSLLGIRRRMNTAYGKAKLPNIPVKLFVRGGWQARDGVTQMQYYDMGGSGLRTDTQCDNCHSASQFRTINYTTRSIAGGAEATLGAVKLTYQHEFRSFNDRRQSPVDFFGTAGDPAEPFPPGPPQAPVTLDGLYVHSVLPGHQTQADTLQVSMAVSHHVTFNGDVSYARTNSNVQGVAAAQTFYDTQDLFGPHNQNALNADATVTWNPVSPLRVIADFHQQNLLNDFVPFYFLYGNPSLHRHWAGIRLAYRLTQQVDLESYYKRVNVTRSNAFLWPQAYSPDNADPLVVVPATFSNIVGEAVRFHTKEFWNFRLGYEWTGTHDPGYVTDPRGDHRIFHDLTITPVKWFSFTNDSSIILQKSFPGVFPLPNQSPGLLTGQPLQRSNHLYMESAFVTIRPVPQWSIGGGYTYLQDNLRTDMSFANDAGVGLFTESLVPYRQLSQTYSIRSMYDVKKRVGLGVNWAHTAAHSGFRPDLNPADYPVFPGAVTVAGYTSDAAFASAFSNALMLASGVVSEVNVPQSLFGATGDYHFRSGFDAGLRANYGSYTDFIRPDLNGKLQSYSVFVGRTW